MTFQHIAVCVASLTLFASLSLAASGVDGSPQNLNFEDNALAPWQWSAPAATGAHGDIDRTIGHDSRQSFRIDYAAAQTPNVFAMLSQNVPVTPNTLYQFTIHVKGSGVGNAWVGGGPDWAIRVHCPADAKDWTPLSGTFMTGPKDTTFQFIVGIESKTQSLWIDDLIFTPLTTLAPSDYRVTQKSLAPTNVVEAMFPTSFTQSIGVNVFGFPETPGELGQFSDLKFGLVRTSMHWFEAEPKKGQFDDAYWALMKKWVDTYAKNGTRVLFIIDCGNPAYDCPLRDFPKTAEHRAGFARFAAEAATQFKGRKVMFELWNEPDGGITAEEYMALAKATIPAMRKADPNVVVVGPGAHHYAVAWLEKCFDYGLLNLVDVLSIHLYFGMPPAPQPAPELNTPLVKTLRTLVAKYAQGRSVPIMNSEWGYKRLVPGTAPISNSGAVTTTDQTEYLPRAILLQQLWNLRFAAWFCWWTPPESIVHDGDFALLTPTHVPTISYYVMKTLNTQLQNAKLAKRLSTVSADDYVLEFDSDQGKRWVAWTAAAPHALTIPLATSASSVTVTDISGTRTFDLPVESTKKTIELVISGAVQYIHEK